MQHRNGTMFGENFLQKEKSFGLNKLNIDWTAQKQEENMEPQQESTISEQPHGNGPSIWNQEL